MASALARSQVVTSTSFAHSLQCGNSAAHIQNATPFLGGRFTFSLRRCTKLGPARRGAGVSRSGVGCSASAERPVWLPGSPPAKHLDGTLAADFGFDPLNLGEDPADLRWYVQAELVHARFAMLGAAGILGQEVLRKFGWDIPIWYETGAASYFAPTITLFIVQMLLFGWVETKRYYDFVNPGSQKDVWFFWVEPSFEGLEPGYPGGPLFNISGFGTGITKKDNVQQMRTKELKNGRLAMVAVLGFMVQALLTKTGPVDNLLDHLADPFGANVVQTLERVFTSY